MTPVPPAPRAPEGPPPAVPAPAPAPTPAAAPVAEQRPAPAPAPRPTPPAAEDDAAALTPEQFQSIDASVVPVPIESLNRLVLAVDELGSEMTHMRQAIRDLTAALSESQASFARLLASQASSPGSPNVPDPLAAVSGPYVSGAPSATPFPDDAGHRSDHAHGLTTEHANGHGSEHANGLGDLPIVSTGAVQVVIGPIVSLDELDAAVEHIRRITGVESVAVTSFEGPHVVLTAELSRALPLASLLRNELGREVASCRLVDGRIVADFGDAGPRA